MWIAEEQGLCAEMESGDGKEQLCGRIGTPEGEDAIEQLRQVNGPKGSDDWLK
jgi:hypothetical protein